MTATDDRVNRVLQYADFVATHWPDLVEIKTPGTKRRWVQSTTRAESRKRTEQAGLGSLAGLTKAGAPVHLDVLDAMTDVHATAAAFYQLVRLNVLQQGHHLNPSPYPFEPVAWLAFVRDYLPELNGTELGAAVVDLALAKDGPLSLRRARDRTAAALGLVLSGQALDADCPWCGARPLRFELHGPEDAQEPLIVCRSRRVCEPPEADCGTWVGGRPAWIEPEWAWLARRIDVAQERTVVC